MSVTIVFVVLAVAAFVVRQVYLRDSARAVDANEALDRFHQSTLSATEVATTAPAAMTLPVVGVYRYATTGFEHIDVLGGTSHQYPDQTTITVSSVGCGVQLRWDLLKERREEWRLCIGADGVTWQPSGSFYHEFFQHGELQTMTCEQAATLVPTDHLPRDPAPVACHLDTQVWPAVWTVLETSSRTVAGTSVAVTHARMTVDITTKYYEHTTVDYWLDDHGLPISITATKTSKSYSGLIGDVVYTEQLTADLESLTPLQ